MTVIVFPCPAIGSVKNWSRTGSNVETEFAQIALLFEWPLCANGRPNWPEPARSDGRKTWNDPEQHHRLPHVQRECPLPTRFDEFVLARRATSATHAFKSRINEDSHQDLLNPNTLFESPGIAERAKTQYGSLISCGKRRSSFARKRWGRSEEHTSELQSH